MKRRKRSVSHPSRVEILGALPDYLTGTGFCVTPVIGLVHPPFALKMDALEVAEVFEVPLAFLMDPANHEERVFRYEGGERRFFAMPYPRAASAAVIDEGGSAVGATISSGARRRPCCAIFYRFLAA